MYNSVHDFHQAAKLFPKIQCSVRSLGVLLWFGLCSVPAWAAQQPFIEEILILGERGERKDTPGSAHLLDAANLQRFAHTDIQRIVRQVPGVYVQVEDGYGLRPNIGIRGVATERSARITLLEDNIPIAPAPYSAPSAYYFPTIGRISAVEVLTGPSAITQGPYTIGGTLNMLSTPIPDEARGAARLEAGQDATWRLHAHYGMRNESGFGLLVETHQWRSDGYQDIDRAGDSGLDVADYTLKIGFAPQGTEHAFELKYQDSVQDSQQSYLGLTDADFAADPLRRYGISALDQIDTDHQQIIIRHEWSPSGSFKTSLAYYENRHKRNWFKTEGLDPDGSESAQSFERSSWSTIVSAINLRRGVAGVRPDDLRSILHGRLDTPPGSIQLRSNAREYVSRGIQGTMRKEFSLAGAQHNLKIGFRLHEDEEDRLQRNSTYSQRSGTLVLDDLGRLGNAGNRVQTAEALAVHVFDEILWGSWRITPGVRYEDMDQRRVRWEIRTNRTADPSSRANANLRDQRRNETQVWLPGLGIIYDRFDQWSFFAGVHKGFTAPTNAPGVNEEEAWNYELGARFRTAHMSAEAVWFLSDYDNLLGVCTASSGTDCVIGDAFNGDAARVSGLELQASAVLFRIGGWRFPLESSYTYLNGEFETDIADTDFFGDVGDGDPIPYLSEHQAYLMLGAEQDRMDVYLSASYVGDTCTRAACGEFERIEDTLVLDVAASYLVARRFHIFARLENLTRELKIVGRQPYGARPNKDRTATLGLKFEF